MSRRIPFAEIEGDHIYHTLRHFPQVQKSISQVEQVQLANGRNFVDQYRPKKHEPTRDRLFRSTHRLEELSRSSLEEVSLPMDEIRRIIVMSRDNRLSKHDTPTGIEEVKYSIDPVENAQGKLTKRSLSFDPMSVTNALHGFSGSRLTESEFDVQLRRCLNINLTKIELRSLFQSMDGDGSNLIDGVEFTRYFFNLGNIARSKIRVEVVERLQRAQHEFKERQQKETDRIKKWEADQISISIFQPEEADRGIARLSEVALRWESSDSSNLQGFDTFLSPYGFKLQLERSFKLKLSGPECGAISRRFSTKEGECCVDGRAFLNFFTRLQQEVKGEHKKHYLNKVYLYKI